jgi:SAM-dependent methyltransferase
MRMYDDLAEWWPLLSAPEEYAEEAAFYAARLEQACTGSIRRVLELGSGGGNNASHLKARFEMVLVDPAAEMLAVSRRLNPDCRHVLGDMRTVRLGQQFDAVFVHDAVCYMTTLTDLRLAVATAFEHCRPGGAALFAPDHVRENFSPSTDCGGHDSSTRAMRYLEWTWDPDPTDSTYTVDYVLVLRDADGSVRAEHDRHIEGLFSREDWLRVLRETGFHPQTLPLDIPGVEPERHEVYVGSKHGGSKHGGSKHEG